MDYSYQDKINDETRAAFQAGAKAPLIVMPTGSGKTRTAARMAQAAVEKGKRVLWVAHTRELVTQAQAVLDPRVVVCTIQSKPEGNYDLVICDEAHHYTSNQFAERVRAIPFRIGLTATPVRTDGSPLGDLFDKIIVGPSIQELTDGGILVPAEVIRPERCLKPGEIALHPLDAYDKHCAGRKCIIYTSSVEYAHQLAAEADGRAVAVDGSMWKRLRDEAFESHRRGDTPILINCMLATEGYDDPSVSALILARGVGSLGMYLQIIGRGIRCSLGKQDCKVLDLRGVSHIHGDYLQRFTYSLEGCGIRRSGGSSGLCQICGSVLSKTDSNCGVCGYLREHDDIVPKIAGVVIDKFAHKKALPEEKKIEDLAFYLHTARMKGYKFFWALKKFESIHGHMPPSHWIHKAKVLARI